MEKEYLTYLAILGLILSFGFYIPSYFFLWLTPVYNKLKWPGRHLIIVNFALCSLLSYYKSPWLVIIALVDLFWYGSRFLYLRDESDFYPPQEIIDYFKTHKGTILTLSPGFPHNAAIPLKLVNVTGYDPFILKDYHIKTSKLQGLSVLDFGQTTIRIKNLTKEFIDGLNIEYIYSDKPVEGFYTVIKTSNGILLRRKDACENTRIDSF